MSRKLALLIGNSTYGPGLPPLEKPDADIAALAKVLADPAIGGFDDVKPLLDATSATARREVARFFSGRSPDDLLLLYFSGHGLRSDRGSLYLAVQDTEAELLSGTAVPAAFVSEEMDNCRSRRQILILDCCYSGAFEHGAKGPAANPAIAFTGNGLGRFVLTASDSTQLAWEDVAATSTAGLSIFTRHLVGGLESGDADLDGDGLISVDELYEYVYARVVEENPRQTPGKSASKQQGEIFLARNAGGARIRPLPAELMQALDHPLATVREGAVRELGRFLRGSDAGLAKAARAAAEQARDDDSRRVARAADEILAATSPAAVDPPPKLAPEPQPAPGPTSDEGHLSAPAPTSSLFVSPLTRWVFWIILSGLALGVIVGSVANFFNPPRHSRFNDLVDAQSSASTKSRKQTDSTLALLAEAKSWPLVLAYDFNSSKQVPFTGLYSDTSCLSTRLISSGALQLSTKSTEDCQVALFEANPATVAADFYLRVEITKLRGPANAESGLIFRTAPSKYQYYAFMINGGYYSLDVITPLGSKSLKPSTASAAIRLGQTNSLAVLARGQEMVLFINDQKVDQISDATLSSGRVGIAVESHGIESLVFDFDNFELRRRSDGLENLEFFSASETPAK